MNGGRDGASGSPVATVLIPVYNAERYVASAVESVLNQTLRDFELILLNDGSTDNSLLILESLAAKDARCRIYSGPNRGIEATRNAGLALVETEFTILMDADDRSLPQRFEKQIGYLQQNPECVAVGTRVRLIDEEDMPITDIIDRYTHEEIDDALLSRRLGIAHPSSAIRTSALRAIGGYRQGYRWAEDLDLFLRLGEHGRLVNLPEVLLEYRQHIASISYEHAVQQSRSAANAIQDACERRHASWTAIEKKLAPPARVQGRAAVHRKWAWWALAAGNLRTARKHTLAVLRYEPVSVENWRLCACVLRGY